jgi:hypothetical protein
LQLDLLLQGYYLIDYFSYVDDRGVLHENATMEEQDISNNYGCNYGCGIIEATKV